MDFSIIVPVYNVERYLNECIDSLVNQYATELFSYEVILIDDGSTDQSGDICDLYQKKYPNLIRVFHQDNKGLILTRRFGFKQSFGDYIINCDSDDVIERYALERINRIIRQYNFPDIVMYNYSLYDGIHKKTAYENVFSREYSRCVSKSKVLSCFLMESSIVSLATSACRRTCIDLNADYTPYAWISHGEDSLQKAEMFDRAESFVYLNDALYNYRSGSGMTTAFDINYFKSFREVISLIDGMSRKWDIPEKKKLLTIKSLSIAGRAITQSRYCKWGCMHDYKEYLKNLKNDELISESLSCLSEFKTSIKRRYIILLILLKEEQYLMIIILLRVRNLLEKKQK